MSEHKWIKLVPSKPKKIEKSKGTSWYVIIISIALGAAGTWGWLTYA